MFDDRKATSFSTNPMRLYLLGDKYSSHPIHPPKSTLFLKKPENTMIGSSIIGTAADTDF
jgi:hypothetical protein